MGSQVGVSTAVCVSLCLMAEAGADAATYVLPALQATLNIQPC